MATPTAADIRAARRYGPSVNSIAKRYRNPYTGKPLSGQALLLKVASGESGFQDGLTSSAGAKGRTQFMPGTRAAVMKQFGVDPWRSVDEAYHGAALHLRGKLGHSKGLEGYNPGDPSYSGYILKQKVGGSGALRGSVGSQEPSEGAAGPSALGGGGGNLTALLSALEQQKPQIQSAGLQLPAHTAAPALPQGYREAPSGGGPEAKPDIEGLLAQLGSLSAGAMPGAGAEIGSSPPGKVSGGRAVLDPRADRAGVRTRPEVLDFAQEISAIAGSPVRIGTGTRHSRLTVNGNVSNHWNGWAGDIPASGKRLVRLGQAALIAAGMPEAEARKQTGGLYNVGGAQIIFATDEGGNHHDHLHIRPPRKRKR